MSATQDHHWYTPAECAALLEGVAHGDKWRAACPVHGGENRQALGIAQGRDREGNPVTLLHCFAHHCPVEDICAAIGISVKNLFCIHPAYAREHRNAPRAQSARTTHIKQAQEPLTPDAIAEILLAEMIVSDPQWIQACAPARKKLWELAQTPSTRASLTQALQSARLSPAFFWNTLAQEYGGTHDTLPA